MKKVAIIFFSIIGFLFVVLKGFELWLEANFHQRINANPDRAYDISYDDIDLHTFFRGITLDEMKITPLNVEGGTSVVGKVDYAEISGLVWWQLAKDRRLHFHTITFVRPIFEIRLGGEQGKKSSGRGIQGLFGDILARADLNEFLIEEGSALIMEGPTDRIVGKFGEINISASDIETDSVTMTHIVPFKMGNLSVSIDQMSVEVNEYTFSRLGHMSYDLNNKRLLLNKLELGFTEDWESVAERLGEERDIIDFELDTLAISDMDFSSTILGGLDVTARKMRINGLDLRIQKSKKFPRPPDERKPMFKGMIDQIPFDVNVDTIHLSDSQVSFTELGADRANSGTFLITDISGDILELNTSPAYQQEIEFFDAKLQARVDEAPLNFQLRVPYAHDGFQLIAHVGEADLREFNPSLMPLMGVEVTSGDLRQMVLTMNSSDTSSQNTLKMDYENLHLKILREADGKDKKRFFVSALANAAVRTNNLPDGKNYFVAKYESQRNVYRAPFQFIVQSLMNGATRIVPTKAAQKMINKEKKGKK